jgi:hypothetical protein
MPNNVPFKILNAHASVLCKCVGLWSIAVKSLLQSNVTHGPFILSCNQNEWSSFNHQIIGLQFTVCYNSSIHVAGEITKPTSI